MTMDIDIVYGNTSYIIMYYIMHKAIMIHAIE